MPEQPNDQPHQSSKQSHAEDHTQKIDVTITNLCFADDIDGSAGEEEELAKLVERLDKDPTAYGMKINA